MKFISPIFRIEPKAESNRRRRGNTIAHDLYAAKVEEDTVYIINLYNKDDIQIQTVTPKHCQENYDLAEKVPPIITLYGYESIGMTTFRSTKIIDFKQIIIEYQRRNI